MNRILKFNLPDAQGASIKTKNRPNILAVGFQGTPVIWVEAEEGNEVETWFYVALTGEYLFSENFKYVGTAQKKNSDGYYVVHIYKEKDAIDNYRPIPLSEIVMR